MENGLLYYIVMNKQCILPETASNVLMCLKGELYPILKEVELITAITSL